MPVTGGGRKRCVSVPFAGRYPIGEPILVINRQVIEPRLDPLAMPIERSLRQLFRFDKNA